MGTSLYIIENIYNPATFFCFFSLVACSFKEKEKKPRNFEVAWLIMLGLFSCFNYPLFGVGIKSPIDLFIGQCAVYSSAHHHSTIFKDFPLGFFSVCGCYLKYSFKNVLRAYSINFPFHIFKIQRLVICVPLARHSIAYGGLAKNDVHRNHRQKTCQVPFLGRFGGVRSATPPCSQLCLWH